jgi:nanoRNase/pAp phosphatase (c-di-AMP/oligoRNAs hydrolase)
LSKNHINLIHEALADSQELLIITHNDPDPDAIASAVGLRYLLGELFSVKTRIAYRGIVGRAENKALARFLRDPLIKLGKDNFTEDVPIALVDTQPGAGNQPLPAGRIPAIVIDHHSRREESAKVPYANVRPELGSTSTIITGYFREVDLEPPQNLATALFYGIKTDTLGLVRAVTSTDAEAYFYLQPRIDVSALMSIEAAQVPPAYFKSYARALAAAWVYDDVLFSFIGQMEYPDQGAEIADLFLRLQGIMWVICAGIYQKEIILAVRSRTAKMGAGILTREIVGDRGEAGGHGTMAAGHIPLGIMDSRQAVDELFRQALSMIKGDNTVEGTPLI